MFFASILFCPGRVIGENGAIEEEQEDVVYRLLDWHIEKNEAAGQQSDFKQTYKCLIRYRNKNSTNGQYTYPVNLV